MMPDEEAPKLVYHEGLYYCEPCHEVIQERIRKSSAWGSPTIHMEWYADVLQKGVKKHRVVVVKVCEATAFSLSTREIYFEIKIPRLFVYLFIKDIHSEVHSMCILSPTKETKNPRIILISVSPNCKKGLDMGYFLCYIIYVVLHINHTWEKERNKSEIDVDFTWHIPLSMLLYVHNREREKRNMNL